MKDNENYKSSVQTMTVGKSSELGSVLVSLLSCALSLAALAVSCTNLYTLLKLIRLLTPLLTVAQ